MAEHIVVLVTVATKKEGEKLALALVKEKLAACVSRVPGVCSTYWWKGKCETSTEQLLFIKTRRDLWPVLARRVNVLHSYSVPEIIALPMTAGGAGYLRWMDDALKRTR